MNSAIEKPTNMPKLNQTEFDKIIKIFGAEELLNKWTSWQVNLTSEQVEEAIKIKNTRGKN